MGVQTAEPHERLVEVEGERAGAEHGRVVGADDQRVILHHQSGGGVIPQILNQLQHLEGSEVTGVTASTGTNMLLCLDARFCHESKNKSQSGSQNLES